MEDITFIDTPFTLEEVFSKFASYVAEHNPFSGVHFSDLYDWLPADIQAVCAAIIAFSVVMFIIGIIKRLPLL